MLSLIRERLAHGSPTVRAALGLLGQHLPPRLRYGREFIETLKALEVSASSTAWTRSRQGELLESILERAWRANAYRSDYRYKALQNRAADPWKILRSLPVLQKEDFRQSPEDFLTVDAAAADKVTTSGSSGDPAVFYLDKKRAASEWAYVCHAWSAAAYRPGDWRASIRGSYLGGHPPRRWLLSRATKELLFSAMGIDESSALLFWSMTSKRRVRYLHGYPSAIASLASAALITDDKARFRIQGVFPVSEGILPHQEAQIARAFPNAKVLPIYGLSERTAMARYEPGDQTYHFYPLYGYVELLGEDDKPVSVGERGRIVATGLRLTAMPFLRYDTGDTAELVEFDELGGPVVRAIQGRRAQECLITRNGGKVSAAALNLHSEIYEKIFSFRIRQSAPGEAEILAVPARNATSYDVTRFAEELTKNSLGQIVFSASVVSSLPPTPNSKARLFEVLIPQVPGVGS